VQQSVSNSHKCSSLQLHPLCRLTSFGETTRQTCCSSGTLCTSTTVNALRPLTNRTCTALHITQPSLHSTLLGHRCTPSLSHRCTPHCSVIDCCLHDSQSLHHATVWKCRRDESTSSRKRTQIFETLNPELPDEPLQEQVHPPSNFPNQG
jgi:hypothetical protein